SDMRDPGDVHEMIDVLDEIDERWRTVSERLRQAADADHAAFRRHRSDRVIARIPSIGSNGVGIGMRADGRTPESRSVGTRLMSARPPLDHPRHPVGERHQLLAEVAYAGVTLLAAAVTECIGRRIR